MQITNVPSQRMNKMTGDNNNNNNSDYCYYSCYYNNNNNIIRLVSATMKIRYRMKLGEVCGLSQNEYWKSLINAVLITVF